jgi:predicted XRE-type DNA-binding protein
MSEGMEVHDSSGNVFADMGMRDAESRLARAELARAVRGIVRARGLTQVEAARVLGITQPDVSNVLRGKLSRFSEQKLQEFLLLLGMDVTVTITPAPPEQPRGHLVVELAG